MLRVIKMRRVPWVDSSCLQTVIIAVSLSSFKLCNAAGMIVQRCYIRQWLNCNAAAASIHTSNYLLDATCPFE
uniref:Putative secreted protein n=1 Tax=Rhipicephalus microplus TaxID=6941 RepID=A0A6M2DEC4_RHIMP